jgi:hypothetical protein
MNATNVDLASLYAVSVILILVMAIFPFYWTGSSRDNRDGPYGNSFSFKTRNFSIHIWPCNVPGSSLEGTFWIGAIVYRHWNARERQYQYLWQDGTWHRDIGSPEMDWPGCYTTEKAAQKALRKAKDPTWLD